MKSRGGKSQRREEEQQREDQRRERLRRKNIQAREKVGKSWFQAPEGRKLGSLKRPAGQMRDEKLHAVVARSTFPSQNVQSTPCSEVAMSKKCTPLWRETHLQVKKLKTLHVRTTFGSWDVEKVHIVVARSTFRSQNVQSAPCSDHFWKLRCGKSARRSGAKHISKSKCTKHTRFGPLLEVTMWKKCTPLWREAHLEVNMLKAPRARTTFWGSDVLSRGRRKGLCTVSKVSKKWGFCNMSKNDGRPGTLEEGLQRCIFRGRRRTKDVFMRDVRRSGRWFPASGCILEPPIFKFAEMILHDRRCASYDLASLFRWPAQ